LASPNSRGLNEAAKFYGIPLPNGKSSSQARTQRNMKDSLKLLVLGNPGDARIEGKRLKKIVIVNGLLEDICALCHLANKWNGKPINLQIDHINGNAVDNRIENLRILCPNCHSQTDSFGGRNKGKGTAKRVRTHA
jgi:hypothetical protein